MSLRAKVPGVWSAPGLRPDTLTLGQVSTGEKSNETTAIPRLLELREPGGIARFQ